VLLRYSQPVGGQFQDRAHLGPLCNLNITQDVFTPSQLAGEADSGRGSRIGRLLAGAVRRESYEAGAAKLKCGAIVPSRGHGAWPHLPTTRYAGDTPPRPGLTAGGRAPALY
jgi:hypothetical protein